jgi:4-hydroxyphenylpyruvate dioxygenase-like putative hemolysin
MAESGPINTENQGTFIAATLIISILALVVGLFAFREARTAGVGAVALEVRDVKQEAAASKAEDARIKALEERIIALEAKAAPAAPPAADPAAAPAAPAAPAGK